MVATTETILVETDFLFGINPKDKLHNYVLKITSLHENNVIKCYVSSSAFVEFRTVLYSHGKKPNEVHEALLIITDFLRKRKIEEIPLRSEHVIIADYLRSKYPNLSFFDALHAGVALVEKITLVSYDTIYSQINEISWKSFRDF